MTALIFIITTLSHLVIMVFLLRLLLPLCRADIRNPFSQGVLRLTNPVILPLRRLLPPIKRLDTATLVALLLVQLASTAIVWTLRGLSLTSPHLLLLASLHELLSLVLQFYFFALLLYAILSWISPSTYTPAASILNSLCVPVIRPFQRLIPPIAGLDLSVLFALIAIQALQILLN
ncbi:MAG: YggT family protein [Steroidobacteraceae bacterium]